MLLIPCPWCGPRAEDEFTCGGEAISRGRPIRRLSDAEWADYLFMRNNPKGAALRALAPRRGCRRWFNVARDTVTHRISRSTRWASQP